jgi:lysophospholipase L1-like esterase
MKAINVLLAVLISLLLALLVFEGGLRLLGLGPVRTINEFHETLGWAKRPNDAVKKKSREWNFMLETNELGLRDDPMASPEKPANTFRVLALGDSFTLGYVVDRHDLFVDQIEGWWRNENRRVDVINAGTEGYSTDQAVAWFLENGEAFAPDLVVLFPYDNDIYWNGQGKYGSFQKPRFTASGDLETGKLAAPREKGFLEQTAIGKLLGVGPRPEPHLFQPEEAQGKILSEFAPLLVEEPDFLADALARTEGALTALRDKARRVGAELVVAPIPSRAAIYPETKEDFGSKYLGGLAPSQWSADRPVDLIIALARKNGIDTLDARSVLRARAEEGADLYYRDDWHLNPDGNRAFATYLIDELDRMGVFPVEHGATAEGAFPEPRGETGTPTWLVVYGVLWLLLTGLYLGTYRDEPVWQPPLKVAGLLALVFTIVLGGTALLDRVPPEISRVLLGVFLLIVLGFVTYKLGRKIGTIAELLRAFTMRGHWYLMPLVVVLLTIGSLLVVAASSPLVAPFIYTLF